MKDKKMITRASKDASNKKAVSPKAIYLLFGSAILAVGFLVMIFGYEYYFDTSGDIIPGYFLILSCLPVISLIFLLVAYMIKDNSRAPVRFTILVLIAILLPAIQFIFNFSVLPSMRTLPGVYHLFALCEGDYNFDGVNDELYELRNNERTVEQETTIYGDGKTPFSKIVTVTTGTGVSLEQSQIYLWEDQKKMNYTLPIFCEIKSVDIYVTFAVARDADKYKFLIESSDYHIVLESRLLDDGRLKLSLPYEYLQEMKTQEQESYSVRALIRWELK